MERREFLARMGVGAIGLAASTARSAAAAPAGASGRMNLLTIHTDEHNYRTLGCYRRLLGAGQALVWGKQAALDTPHIDSIAAGGCVCRKFHANTPVCSPSRSSFLTGRYPQNTPVTTNNISMDDERVTFAEVLRRAGPLRLAAPPAESRSKTNPPPAPAEEQQDSRPTTTQTTSSSRPAVGHPGEA